VLIALWDHKDGIDRSGDKDTLLDVVSTLSSRGLDPNIDVVEFERSRKETLNEKHPNISNDVPAWVEEYDDVSYYRVTARDVRESIVEYATYNDIDIVAHSFAPDTGRVGFVNDDLEWVVENTPCDSVVLSGGSPKTVEKVTLLSDGLTYVPTKLLLADALAVAHNAHLELVHLLGPDSPRERSRTESYLDTVSDDLLAPITTRIVETDDSEGEAARLSRDSDIMLTELDLSTIRSRFQPRPLIAAGLDSDIPAVFVYSDNLLRYQTLYRRILMRYVFRGLR
jgi:hypothetical protein